ncbi:MAG: pilus assembly protein PilC, partial [Gammaproteobacteria bacterium]|nr:pilus assembly protein PilC [Gammaproteobacteria bacterium]
GEMYYTALRYLKNQGSVPEYSAIPGNTGIDATRAADGFPIIDNWKDPIEYACQKNVLLGIGDVYTHRDKNLPGSSAGTDEPAMPPLVSGDSSIDVVAETAKVSSIEGMTINTPFSGRQNSAFMAGLAWDAHTRDMRPGLPGEQTASTHWVDVLEGQSLEGPVENQYYLTAKFGGFDLPEDFDPDTHTGPLDLDWWNSSGEILTTFGGRATPYAGFDFPKPDNYYLAGEASDMVQSLTEAFANIAAEVRSSASAVAANSTRLGSDTAVYQAAFDSHNWSGDLQAFRINADGTINATAVWSAASELDGLAETSLVNRNILTVAPPVAAGGGSFLSTTGVDFDWSSLATSQQDALRQPFLPGPLVSSSEGQDRLDYLRGSRLLERPDGLLRKRDSRLGDISNSDPQLIGDQDFGYALLDYSGAFTGGVGAAYTTYRNSAAYQSRPPVLIVGANDGMLHAFNAELTGNGGEELFAFVPHSVFDNLYELTLPEYSHRFYVDSAPRFADAYFGSAWHTVAVGATGAGGKSVFALDVTDPTTMNPSDVLWEFSHPSMGYTIGQPAIVPLPNGKFGAVVTSGYETGQTDGTIWILDVEDGSIIKTFTTPNSGDLGAPLVVDLDGDRVADRVHVGDTQGNLWRFDLVSSNTSSWSAPASLLSGGNPVPLFVARDANGLRQAITAPLSSAFNEDGLHTIFFGTGSFYRINDNVVLANPDVDTFYAVIDRGISISGRATFLEQSILEEVTANGFGVRAVTANVLQHSHDGWYLDLQWKSAFGGPGPIGERVVSRATVRGDRVIFATVIPDRDPCSFGGDSWIMELNSFNGGRLDYAVFDLDADGEFNDDDWVTVTDENGDDILVPASGIDPDIGIVKTPAIITGVGDNNDEVKVLSGSSGQLIKISERGGIDVGRQSWRQLR